MKLVVGVLLGTPCACRRHWRKRPRLHCAPRNPVQSDRIFIHPLRAFLIDSRCGAPRPFSQVCRVSDKSELNFDGDFDPITGLPLVREQVKYGELLRDIRLGKVKEIHWLTQKQDLEIQGPCLVEYHNGTIKQSHVAHTDMRIPQAMEVHGIKGVALQPSPSYAELNPSPPPSEVLLDAVTKILPVICLGLVYISVQYMAWKKGDMDDRKRIRQKERDTAKKVANEIAVETQEGEAETLAGMGWSSDEIMEELERLGIEYEKEHVLELVAKAERKSSSEEASSRPAGVYATEEEIAQQLADKEKRQRAREEDSEDPMDQANRMLSLSTMKFKKAKTRDEQAKKDAQRKMRQLQRKMKGRGMKLQYTDDDEVFFDDVAGIGNAKFEVMEVVDFFINPGRFRSSGARIPRGVLLCGPPGCGKTMLARAVAGEAGASFLSVNASEFVEMFIGVGASRVRDLFQEARKNAPAIVFIDEVDAVGRVRGGAMGNDERDQTVNQLLSELDGFTNKDADVVVMAATNRRDVLDPALIRAGRFDRIVFVGLPDFNGRIEILQVYLDRIPTTDDIDVREIAFETQRFSGAALANLVNIASMLAGRDQREEVSHKDMLAALDYERLGPQRQPYSDKRQRRLAVHEAATSLVSTLMPAIEPVVYATIIPREKYPMGQTVLKVNEQRELTQQFTKRYLEEQLLVVLASRAAEELEFGRDEMSSINQRRLVMARRIVQKLIVSGNMEIVEGIGHQTISSPWQHGRSKIQVVQPRVTAEMHEVVDKAMEKKLNGAYQKVKDIVERNRTAFEELVNVLLKDNVIQGAEVRSIVEKYANPIDLNYRNKLTAEGFL